MIHVVFRLSLLTIFLAVLVVAPFNPEHPYNVLNPLIDPWWEQLDKKTQKEVYDVWTQYEPFLLALAKKDEMLARKVKVGIEKIKAWEALGVAKLKHLKDIIKGEELDPEAAGYDKDKESKEKEKTKTKVNLRTYVDERWEELQRLAQYKTHLYTSKLRAKYDAVEEFVRLLKNKNYKKNLKIIKDVIKYAKYFEAEPEHHVEREKGQPESVPKSSFKSDSEPELYSAPDPEPNSEPESGNIRSQKSDQFREIKSESEAFSEPEPESSQSKSSELESSEPEPEPEQ